MVISPIFLFGRSFDAATLLSFIIPKIALQCNALSVFCAQKKGYPAGHPFFE